MSNKTKKQLLLNLPYFIAGLVCTNLGEAWRIAEGADMSEKLLGFLSALGAAFSNPMPSLHPMDLLIGVCCGAGLRLAVYLKGKNAKKYRHGMEYGSARWGTQKDIEPFEDPVFANNVILTRTERLMMGNRPKNPANARNKNVLVVGGSGSGKTRFCLTAARATDYQHIFVSGVLGVRWAIAHHQPFRFGQDNVVGKFESHERLNILGGAP